MGSGAVGPPVDVDLDDDAGYGIEGGEMSSMDAVRATAASHSVDQYWHPQTIRVYLPSLEAFSSSSASASSASSKSP